MLYVDIDPDPQRAVKGGILFLKDLKLSDTAVYQCKASNKHGTILTNTHVFVVGKGTSIFLVKTVH